MPAPNLVMLRVHHRGIRADSARLAHAIADVREPERETRAHQLRRWYEGFVGELHAHHRTEDELFFPALRQRVSVFEHQVGRIGAGHDHLDGAIDCVTRALEQLGDPDVAWADAYRRATKCAAELQRLLERHLSFEDEFVLPLFAHHFSVDEFKALDARAADFFSLGQRPFSIPWAMANAEPREQESLLNGAPVSFRLMWLATRNRYRRLADEAFGANGSATGH